MPLDQLTQKMPQAGKKLQKSGKTEKDQVIINPPDKEYVNEEKESTAVMAFGRFNPPTVGHEKLIHKVADVAKEHGGSAHVIASHSENKSKDPLPQDKKIGYLKKVAPKGVSVSGSSKEEPSFLHAAKKLHEAGHNHLVMVAGSDRVNDYKERLNHYNGKEGHYNFKSIKVVSSGERDPDAESVEGMSGTKMRAHARAGEMDKFKSGLPKALHPHAQEISDHIRSVKEDVELDERVLNIQQRKERQIQLRRRAVQMALRRKLARQRLATPDVIKRRSKQLAKKLARVRYVGQRGAQYQTLAPSDKISVDRTIDKKVGLIKKVAQRLVPYEKQRELQRFMSVKTGQPRKAPRPIPLMLSQDLNNSFRSNFLITEEQFNLIELHSNNQVSDKSFNKLSDLSEANNLPLDFLAQVMIRGIQEWYDNPSENRSAEQTGFNRLFSFLNGGAAAQLDNDLFEQLDENIRQWFQDKWVRMDTKGNIKGPCAREPGEGKPKCLPLAKARAMDKDDRAAATRRKRREDPNPERSGPAINVRTEEKDTCYHKVKARYKVWPSAYASGALSKCRKKGAANWGNKSEETQIDEISKDTKMRYVAKAAASTNEPKDGEKQSDYLERLHKRMSGIKKALGSTNPSQRFQKEDNCSGAGEEGTMKLVKKYKSDTPGQNEEVDIPDLTTSKLKKITKQLDKSVKVHHQQSMALKKLVSKDTKDIKENFMDGKNPEDKGDMARHGLKGKTMSQLKKVRSSDTASPRAKQLAHWFINMNKGKK